MAKFFPVEGHFKHIWIP